MTNLFRAQLFHTPRNPFVEGESALHTLADGGVAVEGERIVAVGDYPDLRRRYPDAAAVDLRPGILLPGFVDTHVHYPQLRIIGTMGLRLLDWLRTCTLPEEARLADPAYARAVAIDFLRGLLRSGTTTALVFGSHFAGAQEILFEEAAASGIRLASGLVLSDRNLLPELHQTPRQAYLDSLRLIERWHGRGRLRYAVTPRFAVSTSEWMLEAAGALARTAPGLLVQTHLNESQEEVETVRCLFPRAVNYLSVYALDGGVRPLSVFAHNIHATDAELDLLAIAGASVAHCPSSNAFLGSGLFPMRRHVARGVHVALGSDVGAGTGLCLLKEGLAAYHAQMLQPDGYPLGPAHLLYLATRAGAIALGLEDEAGDLSPGRSADMVLVSPPAGSTLEAVLSRADSPRAALGAVFTLGGDESIARVYLAGRTVHERRSDGER